MDELRETPPKKEVGSDEVVRDRHPPPNTSLRQIGAGQPHTSSSPPTQEAFPKKSTLPTIKMRLGDMAWSPIRRADEPHLSKASYRAGTPAGCQMLNDPASPNTASPPEYSADAVKASRLIEGLPLSSSDGSSGLTLCASSNSDGSGYCHDKHTLTSRHADLRSSSYEPVAAHKIFSSDAHPLLLPHLDHYLTDPDKFSPPRFSDARSICSMEEFDLFEYNLESRFQRRNLELCGAQLKVPRESKHTKSRARRRRGRHATGEEEGDEEELPSRDTEDTRTGEPSRDAESAKGELYDDRSSKIPPLMLLEQNSLDELKSNSIGPRQPPGGLLGLLPGLGAFLGVVVDFVIGVEGSTWAAGIFRLQLFVDLVQIIRLNSSFVRPDTVATSKVNHFFLISLPSILALDFVSVFGAAVLVLLVLSLFVALLLFFFWRMLHMYNPNRTIEGYRSQPWLFRLFSKGSVGGATPPWRSTLWTKFANILVVMLLSTLYIPLGKLALDAIVWKSDYWPAASAQLFHDHPDIYRDPDSICYTTTLRRDQFNWAYIIVAAAILIIVFYTLWFPYAMRRAILSLLPRAPRFNEMGQLRSKEELDAEYMRLLNRDSSPLNFLYHSYKRRWGNYKPLYLLVFKFSNMIIISLLAQDTCLWRKREAKTMLMVQQVVLIVFQSVLLAVHLVVRPFVDEISNRSELVSRISYVVNNVLGLLVALKVKDYAIFNTWLLYIVYALTYSGNIYFALANTNLVGHWIKKAQRRIDYSVDIFSPFLHLDKHIKRRVWQETLSILLLAGHEYRMPANQLVTFEVLDDACPPYLLSFQGSAAERHVENLKIVKHVGMQSYRKSVADLRGPDAHRWREAIKKIQLHHVGPDAYWKPMTRTARLPTVSTFFGKAVMVPFPPTLVISYDQMPERDDRVVQLGTLWELEAFIWQNSSEAIQRRKWIRSVFRAMDGQRVKCPYVLSDESYNSNMFSRAKNAINGRSGRYSGQYSLAKPLFYSEGVLRIKRKPRRDPDGLHYQAGFDVSVTYEAGCRNDAEGMSVVRRRLVVNAANAFGLREDFEWTSAVGHFFQENDTLIETGLPRVESTLRQYRHSIFTEVEDKRKMMHYDFLLDVFDQPVLTHEELKSRFGKASCSNSVRRLPDRYPATTTLLLERLNILHRSPVHRWWFLFWDDLWRKNAGDYSALRTHADVFCPSYPSSLAWTPLPRAQLQEVLKGKSGLWCEQKRKSAIFNPGLLNQIYFTLEQLAFGDPSHDPIQLGFADKQGSLQKTTACQLTLASQSRLTGGGTDHDETSVLDRQDWAWTEQRLGAVASGGLWQKVRRFLALDRTVPNLDIEEIWIYAKLVEDDQGKLAYQAERQQNRYRPYRRKGGAVEAR